MSADRQILVNGRVVLVSEMSVQKLLMQLHLVGKRVAVERNGEIVPKSLHPDTLLEEGDRVEIVAAVGGG